MCNINNKTDPGCPQECVGDCGKVGRENIYVECSDGGTHNSMNDTVILEKGER